MSIREISFTSRERAESLPGSSATAIISITDPGTLPAQLAPTFRHVLRLSFFDALPADDYIPVPGLFTHEHARQICDFVDAMQADPDPLHCIAHCEFGISRPAAVALFIEAYTRAPLRARDYACDANEWILHLLTLERPPLCIEIPTRYPAQEQRAQQRP